MFAKRTDALPPSSVASTFSTVTVSYGRPSASDDWIVIITSTRASSVDDSLIASYLTATRTTADRKHGRRILEYARRELSAAARLPSTLQVDGQRIDTGTRQWNDATIISGSTAAVSFAVIAANRSLPITLHRLLAI